MVIQHVFGIDPGLVHTGVVRLTFMPSIKKINIGSTVVLGTDVDKVKELIIAPPADDIHVFIEGYKPRSHFNSDSRMTEAVALLKREIPGSKVLLNHGSKRVIKRNLLILLGVRKFSQTTHHQDLEAAARIAIFGMLKDEPLNHLLYTVVDDHLNGKTWDVQH